MKIAFFDTKPYDVPGFEKCGRELGIQFKFYDSMLTEDTVSLAKGADGVCSKLGTDSAVYKILTVLDIEGHGS